MKVRQHYWISLCDYHSKSLQFTINLYKYTDLTPKNKIKTDVLMYTLWPSTQIFIRLDKMQCE